MEMNISIRMRYKDDDWEHKPNRSKITFEEVTEIDTLGHNGGENMEEWKQDWIILAVGWSGGIILGLGALKLLSIVL